MREKTWRQGYVPGKAKKTIHIDDEVARVLEIRAAQERVSQAEIVERALRKELGIRRALGMDRLSLGRDEFAAAMGFADYEALIAASESVVQQGDVDWYVTALPEGRWAAWDDAELSLDRVAYFGTREEAAAFHLDAYESKNRR